MAVIKKNNQFEGLALRNVVTNGFTLIEILVTMTIIAVLVAVAMVSYTSINKRSRDARRRSDVEQLRSALEMYRSDNSSYPYTGLSYVVTTDATLATALANYFSPIPSDPLQTTDANANSYWYKPTSCTSTTCYGYCIVAFMEQSGNAVTTTNTSCTSSVPATVDRTASYAVNP